MENAVVSGPLDPNAAANAPLPGESATGIPPKLVKLVRDSYPYQKPDPASELAVRSAQEQVVNTRNNNYDMLRPAAAAFETAWAAYGKRKAEIDKVLEKANKLEQAGKLDDAHAALLAAVPAPAKPADKRALIEPRDAEVPVLLALARVASARKSAHVPATPTLLRVAAALWSRRPIGTRDDELWLWLAHDDQADNRLMMWENQLPEIRAARTKSNRMPNDGALTAYKLLDAGVENDLAKLVRDQAGSQDRWPQIFDEAPTKLATFEPTWRAYVERGAIVAAAIAEAEVHEKAGKVNEARTKLTSVITATEPGASRSWIETRDAELPAINALARVSKTQKDWKAFVVDVTSAMWSRRQISTADHEIAAYLLRGGKQYDANDPDGGRALANHRLYNKLTEDGLPTSGPEAELVVTRGNWVVLRVPTENWQNKAKTVTASGKSIKFKMVIDANDKFCKKTNRIERYDPDGSPVYEQECTYKPRKDTYAADIALTDAAPAWALEDARAGGKQILWILGKVAASTGKTWRLDSATILDLRFTR